METLVGIKKITCQFSRSQKMTCDEKKKKQEEKSLGKNPIELIASGPIKACYSPFNCHL